MHLAAPAKGMRAKWTSLDGDSRSIRAPFGESYPTDEAACRYRLSLVFQDRARVHGFPAVAAVVRRRWMGALVIQTRN